MKRKLLGVLALVSAPTLLAVAAPALNVGFGTAAGPSWSASTGSWRLADGLLVGENGRALFSFELGATRRVEATIVSLAGEWAAVVGQYGDENNWIEVRVTSSGCVLVARAGGQERSWSQGAAVSFPVSVTLALGGSGARVLLNGTVVLEVTEPTLAPDSGPTAVGVGARGQASFSQFHASSFAGPALITSLGRSPGGLMAKVLAERAGLAHEYAEGAQPNMLPGMQTLVLVVGASSKGLGAAGISLDDEVARGRALVAEARRLGLGVVLMHIEGEPRRGTLSDVLINEFVPQADYVVVKADGNADGLFTALCQTHGLPLRTIAATAEAAEVLVDLFGLWR